MKEVRERTKAEVMEEYYSCLAICSFHSLLFFFLFFNPAPPAQGSHWLESLVKRMPCLTWQTNASMFSI